MADRAIGPCVAKPVQHAHDGCTVFQVTVPNWLVDELAALWADDGDAEEDDPRE